MNASIGFLLLFFCPARGPRVFVRIRRQARAATNALSGSRRFIGHNLSPDNVIVFHRHGRRRLVKTSTLFCSTLPQAGRISRRSWAASSPKRVVFVDHSPSYTLPERRWRASLGPYWTAAGQPTLLWKALFPNAQRVASVLPTTPLDASCRLSRGSSRHRFLFFRAGRKKTRTVVRHLSIGAPRSQSLFGKTAQRSRYEIPMLRCKPWQMSGIDRVLLTTSPQQGPIQALCWRNAAAYIAD